MHSTVNHGRTSLPGATHSTKFRPVGWARRRILLASSARNLDQVVRCEAPSGVAEVAVAPRRPVRWLKKAESKAKSESVQGDLSDGQTLEALRGLVRRKRWKEAAKVFSRLQTRGVEVPSEVEVCLLEGVCSLGGFRLSWEVYSSIHHDTCLPYSMYHRLMCLALQAGSMMKSLRILKTIKNVGYSPNQVTYCTIISGLLRDRRKGTGTIQTAYNLWKELEASGKFLDAGALRVGCNACVSRGKLDEANSFIDRMRKQGFRPDSRLYNILLKGSCKKGDMESAFEILSSMRVAGLDPDRLSYNTVIQAFSSRGQMKRARALLEDAEKEGLVPDLWTYTSLLNGFVKSNNIEEAESVFAELKEAGLKPNVVTYGTIINGYVMSGQMNQANTTFQEMLDAGVKPNIVISNTVLKAHCSRIMFTWPKQIHRFLKQMGEYGLAPGVDTYNTILSSALDQGHPELCVEIFDHMIGSGLHPDAVSYTVLMKSFLKKGKMSAFEDAYYQIKLSPGAGSDLISKNALVACYAQSMEMELAEAALLEAVSYAESIGQPVPLEAFGAVIAGYSAAGNLQKALSTFRRFFQLGGNPDYKIFAALLKICVEKGETDYARKILRAMDHAGVESKEASEKWTSSLKSLESTNQPPATDMERLKFWMGLPNDYYDSSWP